MEDEEQPGARAPLQAYLEIAYEYYMQDRLDAAMTVALDAFERAGWPPGLWTAFYNELVCEKDAREASVIHKVDEGLSIELPQSEPADVYENLKVLALEARERVGKLLGVDYHRPVMNTVFLPDAPVDFIVGSHGYVSHKVGLDKICMPYETLRSRRETVDTLLHEFSHVAAYELAADALPRWLGEGLATYLCGDLSSRHCRSVIGAAVRSRRMLGAGRLEATLNSADLRKEDPDQVEAAYYVSGSLVAWWVERAGLASVRDVLARIGQGQGLNRAIRKAAGMSLRSMEREWRRELYKTHGSRP